jgi:hypothetical protein
MSMESPRFVIDELRYFERDVTLRLPFRFGMATVTACPQVYVQARIRFSDGSVAEGCAAEMMIPKWFDKNPALSNDDNFQQLRSALLIARDAYTANSQPRTAWEHFSDHYQSILAAGEKTGLNPLAASYGPALVDRAVLDALCLKSGVSFAQAMSANLPGINLLDNAITKDLAHFDMGGFMERCGRQSAERRQIAARHTVGLADALITRPDDAPRDGLPTTLLDAIERYGHRYFKIKLSGNSQTDLARLEQIARLIDHRADLITFDGNEQYADAQAFADFFDHFEAAPALAGLRKKLAFIEQPLPRSHALQADVKAVAKRIPLLIDESDATLDSFRQAHGIGYTGVSSKSCKGVYKSVINAARCALWTIAEGIPFFQSGEDLTMQAGIGVQQDLALVGWLGLAHVERNGHHYVNGMHALPAEEQLRFQTLHPKLYEHSDGAARLSIRNGFIDLTSLNCPGFATAAPGAGISWDAMRSTY